LFLGREPEDWSMIADHMTVATLAELRRRFANSAEFRAHLRPLMLQPVWVARELSNGRRIWLNLADSFVSQGVLGGEWEASETHYMRSRLGQGDIALDIGANIGWFTLVAADVVGEEGHVHAFEPNPTVLHYLVRTIIENDLQRRVTTHDTALWDIAEERFVGTVNDDYNLGHAWLLHPGEEAMQGVESAKARCDRLDDVLPGLRPNFIKIDIEGAEPRALRGGSEMISAAKPIILSEVYPAQISRVSGSTSGEFIADLQSLGYDCWLLERGEPVIKIDDFPPGGGRELISVAFEPKPTRYHKTVAVEEPVDPSHDGENSAA
jgi:FkbM family methyltransferase